MWKQYKKTLIPMQIVIFLICGWLAGTGRISSGGAVVVFLSMQLANLAGAWWAARMKRQIEASDERLPLE